MLLHSLVSGEAEDEDTADEEIGGALDTLQGLLQLTQRAQPNAELDLQALQLPPRSAAEKALARYSWLGTATIGLASHALSALPFGAPVAAVLNGLYRGSVQVGPQSSSSLICCWVCSSHVTSKTNFCCRLSRTARTVTGC